MAESIPYIESILTNKLNGIALRIEHVGSTSVPGLAAKPILDIDIVIESMEHLPRVIRKLDELGYVHEGNLGIKNREAFARRDIYVPYGSQGNEKFKHYLYVCDKESEELKTNNRNAYTEGKTKFITRVMKEYKDIH